MHWKTLLPKDLRLRYQLLKRRWADQHGGLHGQWARPGGQLPAEPFAHALELAQPILPGPYFDNKIHNIGLASAKFSPTLLLPGAYFSFWAAVGRPGRRQGYRQSRNLVAGQLRGDYGGGICQVSGLLYYLALHCGLEILERHHHSVDIYAEHERFAPLGADATVVFGYKDLRFRNTLQQPLLLDFRVQDAQLIGSLRSPAPVGAAAPDFLRSDSPGQRHVVTRVAGVEVARSKYMVQKK